MNRDIFTYTDLTRLGQSSFFERIRHYPIVTVSADLRKGLIGKKDFDLVDGILSKDSHIHVTEFQNLSQAIYGEWNSDQNKFYEMILLSEYVRKKVADASGNSKTENWLTGCMRNLGSILSSIIMLEQAEVRPEDIETGGERNLELLLGAWKYLIERDPSIRTFHQSIERVHTKEQWDPVLRTAFGTIDSFQHTEAIVFHGFYYITPLQERIMCSLEEAGFRLIFLIPYDERYPFAHEIWDETYSEKRGYPPKNRWHIERSAEADPYGDMFEGKERIPIHNNLKMREYASVIAFVDDVTNIMKMGCAIYSSNYRAANKILQDYYPEEYGERKILSYPNWISRNVLWIR